MNKNNLLFGVAIGVIAPLLAYALTVYTDWLHFLRAKPISFYVLAAVINLTLLRYAYRRELENTGRGIILVTFLATLLLIFTQNLRIR